MKTTQQYKALALRSIPLLVSIILVIVVLFRKPQQVYAPPTKKYLTAKIVHLKGQEQEVEKRVLTYKETLTTYKELYDTINIVRYQDSVITFQDTQIVVLKEIVNTQDTLITVLKHDNKRLKRQRNILVATTAVLGTIAIIK